MKKFRCQCFTMVELLAVVAIISILAAIGFGAYSYATGRAKESATRALVKQLEAGIEAFHAKYGYYPPADAYGTITVGRNATSNVVETVTFGSGSGAGNKYTIGTTSSGNSRQDQFKRAELAVFMKAVEMETIARHLDGNGRITDAYGGAIHYRAPGVFNATGFDLIAPGEDGGFGSGNASAPPATLSNYKDGDNDWICDDIANF